MTFLTIVLTVTDVFGGRGGPTAFGSPKDEGTINKWLNSLADALTRFAGYATEPLPAIVGSIVGDFFRFFGNYFGILVEHKRALNICVARLTGLWLKKLAHFSS